MGQLQLGKLNACAGGYVHLGILWASDERTFQHMGSEQLVVSSNEDGRRDLEWHVIQGEGYGVLRVVAIGSAGRWGAGRPHRLVDCPLRWATWKGRK